MESLQVFSIDEFWKTYRRITREIIKEEIQKNLPQNNQDEILLMDDLSTLLGKTKQTLFQWLKDEKIKGHYINGSLFFMRSEVMDMIKKGEGNNSKKRTIKKRRNKQKEALISKSNPK